MEPSQRVCPSHLRNICMKRSSKYTSEHDEKKGTWHLQETVLPYYIRELLKPVAAIYLNCLGDRGWES